MALPRRHRRLRRALGTPVSGRGPRGGACHLHAPVSLVPLPRQDAIQRGTRSRRDENQPIGQLHQSLQLAQGRPVHKETKTRPRCDRFLAALHGAGSRLYPPLCQTQGDETRRHAPQPHSPRAPPGRQTLLALVRGLQRRLCHPQQVGPRGAQPLRPPRKETPSTS